MLTENQIKRKSYFVKEAIEMIKEKGLYSLSARTVAKAAGFNGASIYTYFENMDHLTALACVYFIQDYVHELMEQSAKSDSWLERNMLISELFLKYSMKQPDIYSRVFFPSSKEPWIHTLHKEFYEMFPGNNLMTDNALAEFVVLDNAEENYLRNMFILTRAEAEGSIKKGSIPYISELQESLQYYTLKNYDMQEIKNPDEFYRKILKCMLTGIYYYITDEYRGLADKRLKYYEEITL